MKKIELEEAEVSQVMQLEGQIGSCHSQIGALREREAVFLGRLIQLRQMIDQWESAIGAKYHLPHGLRWSLDPKTKTLSYEETKEEEVKGPLPPEAAKA